MENIISPTWAEINLDNLRHNIESFKEKSSIKKISAVIKANAYGHGAVDVAREIEDIVDYFSVSSISLISFLKYVLVSYLVLYSILISFLASFKFWKKAALLPLLWEHKHTFPFR